MKNSDMSKYMRQEMWVDRVKDTMRNWERIQGIEIPNNIKETVVNFMTTKIAKGINTNTLLRTFMQIAVTALVYIKLKRIDKK